MAKIEGKVKVSEAVGFLKKKAPKAWKEGKGKEVEVKGGFLPKGINNGVAQLNSICFIKVPPKQKGQKEYYRFEVRGITKEPKTFDNQPIAGKPVIIRVDFIETKDGREGNRKWKGKTIADRAKQMQDILKLLKGENLNDTDDYDDVDGLLEELLENKPHFSYRTWAMEATKANPNPRVNIDITGLVSDYEDSDDDDEDVEVEEDDDDSSDSSDDDDSDDDSDDSDSDDDSDDSDDSDDDDSDSSDDSDDSDEDSDDEEAEEEIDFLALGKSADKNNKKAKAQLTELAGEADLDTEDYKTWTLLAKALKKKAEEESSDDDDDADDSDDSDDDSDDSEEDSPPSKGDSMKYKPPKARKAIDVEVIKVNVKKEVADVKALDSDKKYTAVPFSELKPAD